MRNILLLTLASVTLTACFTQNPAPIIFNKKTEKYSAKTVSKIGNSSNNISRRDLTISSDTKPKSNVTTTIISKNVSNADEMIENIDEPVPNHSEITDLSKANNEIKEETATDIIRPNPSEKKMRPPLIGEIMTKYGAQNKDNKVNTGVNIAAKQGDVVKASAGGIVEFAGTDDYYGNIIIVRLYDSNTFVAYANLGDLLYSKKDEISKGDVVGHVAKNAKSGESYLHLAVKKDGKSVDPAIYFELN